MKRFLFAAVLSLLSVLSSPAQGLIIVTEPPDSVPADSRRLLPPPRPPIIIPPLPLPRPYPFAPLEVVSHKVNATISDQLARTVIEQEFYNPNPQALEGTFLFPVPRGAQLDKFSLEIDGKKADAELLAADQARKIYEDIVRSMKDPGLLEYAGRDVFKVRIFPLEPHARRRVTISYTQLLKSDAGLVSFTLPLNTAKFSAKPLKSVSVKVELASKRPLKAIFSPSHKVEVRRDGNQATIGYEANDTRPDTDFQLFFSQESGALGVSLLTQKTADSDGYFLLLATPSVETKGKPVLKDIVFVLDTSGSMAGGKLDQAKKALAFCVENLNDGDRFEVLRFSTDVEPLFGEVIAVNQDSRQRALDFIKELKPLGSTAIDDALKQALAMFPSRVAGAARPATIIFLTDGLPTSGVTDTELILRGVKERNAAGTRVFCFGIGTDVNTHLLDRITEDTRGYSQYVLPEEDLEVKLSSFFTKIKEPALANLKITFPGGVRVTKLYPSPLPDLFKGEQLVLAGRYDTKARTLTKAERLLTIEGTVNGEQKTFSYELDFPDAANEHEFIPRLWATRRVGYLLDEIRLRGENVELKDEVTDLARRYGIVTPYTAYLIVEDEKHRNVPEARRSLLQLERDREASHQSAQIYDQFKREKDGNAAVNGARQSFEFKNADNPTYAVKLGELAARRSYSVPLPTATPTPSTSSPGRGGSATAKLVTGGAFTHAGEQTDKVVQYTQQNRFVGGKNFFQNGEQWIDAEVQQADKAKRVRVQFNSTDYFDLLAKNPQAVPWFAVGKNVQFVLSGMVYEVFE